MSAWMNGENVKVLVSTSLGSPSGLAVDLFMSRLYWCDQRYNFIESIKFDGTDRARTDHSAMLNPFKIDIFENHVYWLSKERGDVNKVDKFGRGGLIKLAEGLDVTSDLKIFHALKVPTIYQNCKSLLFSFL
jgi:low density lipoprotein-related protein 2